MAMSTVASSKPGTDRLLTVPNVITIVRLACLPVFLWLLFGRDSRVAAASLLASLGATDWIDGYIARHFNQVSELGKVLDPLADRLLFIVGVGAMIIDGGVPRWFAWIVVVREVVIGGALVILTALGMKRFDVRWAGKAGTFGLMFAFPMFLLAAGLHGTARTVWTVAAWMCGLPALAFSLFAAVTYVPAMKRNLIAGRAERRAVMTEQHS
jgi:cardiolipin synthase (CMP-forming)